MKPRGIAVTDPCPIVSEFVDYAGPAPEGLAAGEAVIPPLASIYTFIDDALASESDSQRDYVVVLSENGQARRVVRVRGQGVKFVPAGSDPDADSYSIVAHKDGKEMIVARFPRAEVCGIFIDGLAVVGP